MKFNRLYAGIILLLGTFMAVSCEKHEPVVDYSLKIGNIYCQDGRILPPEAFDASIHEAVAVITVIGQDGQDFKAIGVALDEWQDNLLNRNVNIDGVNGTTDDLAGKANTAAIIEAVSSDTTLVAPAIVSIQHYRESDGRWHLPSCGELLRLSLNRHKVGESLDRVGGRPLSDSYYLSSTQDGTSDNTQIHYMRNVSLFEGRVIGAEKTSVKTVRPFLLIQ